MADNFERHRSTRWVKADVPSYGDNWGDDYDNYDNYEQQAAEEPEKETTTTPNLVLSIDNAPRYDYDDDDSERAYSQPPSAISEPKGRPFGRDVSDSSDEDVSYIPESPDRASAQSPHESPQEKTFEKPEKPRPAALDVEGQAADDFVPPTPTFSHSNFSHQPETPVSDRSFISDADSIQREPESLNVAERHDDSLNEISEDPQMEKAAEKPSELVLSVDRMNLNDNLSDDSDSDSDSLHFDSARGTEKATTSTLALPVNEEGPESQEEVDSPLHITSPALPSERHHIKTDALDSLIDDLQRMERSSTYKEDPAKKDLPTPPPPQATDDHDEGEQNLPSLGSIRDMSLPNFEDHSFSDSSPDTTRVLDELTEESQEEVQKAHESYVSSLKAHTRSVKKAPPHSPNIEAMAKESEDAPEAPSTPKQEAQSESAEDYDPRNPLRIGTIPALSPESISTKHLSADFSNMPLNPPQPIRGPASDVSRRDSTMTTSTFNMGNWKPNTSMYRDQFVNDNDNESQMNFSVYNGKENHDKFLGNHSSSSGYAESFTNSSTLSVPETVALPSIHEDTSDAEIMRDDDDTSDDQSFSHINTSKSDGDLSLPGKEHRSSQGSIFKEEKLTLPGSHEQLSKEVDNSEKYKSMCSVESKSDSDVAGTPQTTSSKRMASSSSFGVSKPPKQKYPVSKWKDLTSLSQPIDRIEAFRNAKQKEIDYDSGLQYWLQETLRSTEVSPNMHIGKLAEEAYQNATHTDIRRHTSMALNATNFRNKVSLVKDKMDTTAGFGRRFLNKGKKLMKS